MWNSEGLTSINGFSKKRLIHACSRVKDQGGIMGTGDICL